MSFLVLGLLSRQGGNVVSYVQSSQCFPGYLSFLDVPLQGRTYHIPEEGNQTKEPFSRDAARSCQLDAGLLTWLVSTRLLTFMTPSSTSRYFMLYCPPRAYAILLGQYSIKDRAWVWRLTALHFPSSCHWPAGDLWQVIPSSGPKFPPVEWMWHLSHMDSYRRVTYTGL